MHRACSCLVMCVCVRLSRKAHRQQLREDRRVKENEEEWRSLTYPSLPCKRAAAIQMSRNPYTDECREKLISRQIFGGINTVDGYRRVQRNFMADGRCVTARSITHTTLDGVQTGHRLAKQEAKGQEFSMWADSMTTGQQTCEEVICANPKYCPSAACK